MVHFLGGGSILNYFAIFLLLCGLLLDLSWIFIYLKYYRPWAFFAPPKRGQQMEKKRRN